MSNIWRGGNMIEVVFLYKTLYTNAIFKRLISLFLLLLWDALFFYRHCIRHFQINQHTNPTEWAKLYYIHMHRAQLSEEIRFRLLWELLNIIDVLFCEHVRFFCAPIALILSFFFFLWTDYVSKERQPSWFGFQNGIRCWGFSFKILISIRSNSLFFCHPNLYHWDYTPHLYDSHRHIPSS